ncbi:MAG: DUF1282 family protein [Firmicutes bacterium]|jgi:tetratricopeptide (TPR) repeat protein|nr:DUF1282 family protein [Bacillota bacterium]HKM17247.1 YIP1 family protein [Limnochordia bacterium]
MRITLPFAVHKDKLILLLILMFALLFCMPGAAGADETEEMHLSTFLVPYRSYTWDYWDNPVEGPIAYLPKRVITAGELGLDSLRQPRDLVVDEENNHIYIVDTGNNRIVQLDLDWNVLRIIDGFMNNGTWESFSGPSSVAISVEQDIYVADTGNSRIVHLDQAGSLLRILGSPHVGHEDMFPDTFRFRPFTIGVNERGYMFVLSEDYFEGFITIDADGIFRGVIGAPRVNVSLWEYVWFLLSTEEQKARRNLFLPVEYSGFTLDDAGFIYATVASDEGDSIRRLNSAGGDSLKRYGFHRPIGDVRYTNMWQQSTYYGRSNFVDVTVFPLGIYSVLDRTRSRIYTYDDDGHLLYMFGYRGRGHGQVARGIAIDHIGLDLVVIDDERGQILVFEPTDYTKMILQAVEHYNKGEYLQEEAVWREVLKLNANYDLAYTGIGRSLLLQEEYADAMYYFKLGNNRSGYSRAYQAYREILLKQNFSYVMTGIALIVALFMLWPRIKARLGFREQTAAAKEAAWLALTEEKGFKSRLLRLYHSLKYGLYLISHPFDGFYELKYRQRGSVPAAFVILILVTITYTLMRQYTGFLFNHNDPSRLNIIVELASVILPFGLWTGVNWAFTTLMTGKGTFKQIVIASAYALIPIIIINLPMIIVSNYLILEEGTFYFLFVSVAMMWAGALMFIGVMMVTHEYGMGKSIFTTILTLVGMIFTIFLGLVLMNLLELVYRFANEMFTEIAYRL